MDVYGEHEVRVMMHPKRLVTLLFKLRILEKEHPYDGRDEPSNANLVPENVFTSRLEGIKKLIAAL